MESSIILIFKLHVNETAPITNNPWWLLNITLGRDSPYVEGSQAPRSKRLVASAVSKNNMYLSTSIIELEHSQVQEIEYNIWVVSTLTWDAKRILHITPEYHLAKVSFARWYSLEAFDNLFAGVHFANHYIFSLIYNDELKNVLTVDV